MATVPSSTENGHDWNKKTFSHFTWCNHCHEFIWGLKNQGLKCKHCSMRVHPRCAFLCNPVCSGQRVQPQPAPTPGNTQHASTPSTSTTAIATGVNLSHLGVNITTGLPQYWEMKMDPSSNHFYYLNHEAKTTTWELPLDVLKAIPLPERWEAALDKKTGRLFFVDHANRATSWSWPAALMLTPDSFPPPTTPHRPSPAAVATTATVVSQPQNPPTTRGGAVAPALPPKDQRVTDLVAMGFQMELASVVAGMNPTATLEELVTMILQRAGRRLSVTPPSALSSSNSSNSKESTLCKVCMEKEQNALFMPCAHLCCCMECASQVKDCPICRAQIAKIQHVFTS